MEFDDISESNMALTTCI